MPENQTYVDEWPFTVLSTCQVCEGTTLAPDHAVEQPDSSVLMVKCRSCGHIQVGRSQRPLISDLSQASSGDEFEHDMLWEESDLMYDADCSLEWNITLSHLGLLGFKGGTLLHIGSAMGQVAHVAGCRGYTVLGVEPDASARYQAREALGVESVATVEDVASREASFDVVVCSRPLNNIVGVRHLLKQIRTLLRCGGCLVLKAHLGLRQVSWLERSSLRLRGSVPSAQGEPASCPLYCYHVFTAASVSRLLRGTGFRLISIADGQGAPSLGGSMSAAPEYGRPEMRRGTSRTTFPQAKPASLSTIYVTVA